ncbi:glutathione peroxidase 7-like [Lineus longissimus]|uniref:glutathione peroxidase 7-like n=1 Tax=Lineus longissimus TaxID=88925 RepID=UPI002B4D5153
MEMMNSYPIFFLILGIFAALFVVCSSAEDANIEYDSEGRTRRKAKAWPHADHTGEWLWDAEAKKWYLPKHIDFYSFNVSDISGREVSLEQYRGKVSMVVNVASECGWTDNHYTSLVELQKEFHPSGKFNVLAFPCNQFGGQEPGSNSDIKDFAIKKYGVNFPLFGKLEVHGENTAPVFQYLNKHGKKTPTWNFWKWLVDAEGQVRGVWESRFLPSALKHLVVQLVKEAKALENPEDPNNPHGFHHGEL